MSHPNPYLFESLGSNCEFGFYQSHRGHAASTLFKWAGYPRLSCLQTLIEADLSNILDEEHTVPFNREVVLDLHYGVGWHAQFDLRMIDECGGDTMGNLAFVKGADWTLSWATFQCRIQALIRLFRSRIAQHGRILVLKDLEGASDDQILDLHQSLRRIGSRASLMVVCEAAGDEPPGHSRRLRADVITVRIARFAPGDHVQTFCARSWDQVCRAALRDLSSNQRRD